MRCLKVAKTASSRVLLLAVLATFSSLGSLAALGAKPSHRIVALTPALTDILLEVLPEFRRGELVATSDFARLPTGISIPSVASATAVNLEKVAALAPTLVLDHPGAAHASRLKLLNSALARKGTRIEVLPTARLEDIAQAYRAIGLLVGEAARGEKLATELTSGISKLVSSASGQGTTFLQMDSEPLLGVGGGSDFLVELLSMIGVKNVFSALQQSYPVVSEESVVAKDPDWIIVLGFSSQRPKFLKMAKRWRERHPGLKAVRSSRVCVLDSDRLTRPSTVMLEGARELLKLYQEKSCRD